MQTNKLTLFLITLMLIFCGCGNKENSIPSAAESMKRNKMVKILTDAVNTPFEFGSGTGVQGLDVDLGNEIAKDLGIEVKWIKSSGYDHLFEVLKNGEAELIISTISIDPSKNEEFAFSDPYYESGDAIARRRDVFDIEDLSSLSGKKVGVCAGRAGDKFMAAQQTARDVFITKFSSFDDALGALNRTELDALVGDEPILTYSSHTSYQYTITLPNLINEYQYAVVVRKNDEELLDTINATIDRLKKSGEIEVWTAKWFENVREERDERLAKDLEEEGLKTAPKTIAVSITKVAGAWRMDRLDGFQLIFEGPAGNYQSDFIRTEGNQGHCKFLKPVPPGEYKLSMRVLRTPTPVHVPELPKRNLKMEISLGSVPTIQFK